MILSPLVLDLPDLRERVGFPGLPLFKDGFPPRPGGRVSPGFPDGGVGVPPLTGEGGAGGDGGPPLIGEGGAGGAGGSSLIGEGAGGAGVSSPNEGSIELNREIP